MLVRNGHRVIGVLQGLPGTLPNEQRLSGFKQVLDSAGIPFNGKLVAGDNFTEESGYESARRLLTARPDITAFVAMSTPNALGALRVVAELGLSVPAPCISSPWTSFNVHRFVT